MEKIWQHAHFLIYNNDKSNIHELRTAENVDQKNGNVTHKLLVKGRRCDETACHKMCNIIHPLSVIGKDVMIGLP